MENQVKQDLQDQEGNPVALANPDRSALLGLKVLLVK
jgi:hypothetical protein